MVDKEMKERLLGMTVEDKASALEILLLSLCENGGVGSKAESLVKRFSKLSPLGKIKVLNTTLSELKAVETKEKKIGKR